MSEMTPFALSNFRVIRSVTRSLLKLVDGQPAYIKIDGAFKQAEQSKKPKMVEAINEKGEKVQVPMPPPFVVDVTNLQNDQPMQMVANEVFKEELTKQYPGDTYVDKIFEIIKNTKAEGKNYNTFGITELAPVQADAPAPETTSKKK